MRRQINGQGLQKVNTQQYREKALALFNWRASRANSRVLGLLIMVIVVLLLGRGNG